MPEPMDMTPEDTQRLEELVRLYRQDNGDAQAETSATSEWQREPRASKEIRFRGPKYGKLQQVYCF